MNAPPPAPDNFFYMEEKKPVCTPYPSEKVKEVRWHWNQNSIVDHNMDRWRMNRWTYITRRKRKGSRSGGSVEGRKSRFNGAIA